MKIFSCYLYENFDADREAANPANPRRILTVSIDPILSCVSSYPPRACPAAQLRSEFGDESIARLIAAGVLREENGSIAYDTPIFLSEDIPALREFFKTAAVPLADCLWERREKLWSAVRAIQNGFDAKTNLYHILCGMIFDGYFFDWLGERGAIAVSRPHASGLDYLAVIYENHPGLQAFSDKILCSYNRLTDGETALESFGDADGDRFDLYRVFRLREQRRLPDKFQKAGVLLDKLPKGDERRIILAGARELLRGTACRADCLAILELFGYAENGEICVPVFSYADRAAIEYMAELTEEALYAEIEHTLLETQKSLPLTAVRHGVAPEEIANELYHILFGGINEELVKRGLVAAPACRPGEGRYLKCIEWQDI